MVIRIDIGKNISAYWAKSMDPLHINKQINDN